VKKVEGAEKNTKAIDRWIKDISDLHRSKPPPTVHYSKYVSTACHILNVFIIESVLQKVNETNTLLGCLYLPQPVGICHNTKIVSVFMHGVQGV
jgi:intraflagellar transport protein 46